MEFPADEELAYVDCTNIGIKDKSQNDYHCVCGKLVLTVNKPMQKLPLRKTDGARVLDSKKHIYRIISDPEPETVHILRKKGVEKQFRFKCEQCKLPVFYKHDTNSGVTFILKNALIGKSNSKLSKLRGKKVKKEETQKAIPGIVLTDNKTKIGGISLSGYRENYQVIKKVLEKQGKWKKDN